MSGKIRFGSAVMLALFLVSIFGFAAFADDNSTKPGPPSSEDMAKMEAQRQEEYQNFIAKLAANLGVDEDTLEAALEATQKEILAEQVEKGVITQEQADKMSERGFRFGFGMGGHGPGGHGGPGGPGGQGGPGGPPPGETPNSSSS